MNPSRIIESMLRQRRQPVGSQSGPDWPPVEPVPPLTPPNLPQPVYPTPPRKDLSQRLGPQQPVEPVPPLLPPDLPEPVYPTHPRKDLSQRFQPVPPVGAALTGQRRMTDTPPSISDPSFEQWYQGLPPDQKIKYKHLYEQWLMNQP